MGKIRHLHFKFLMAALAVIFSLGMSGTAYPAELLQDPGFQSSFPNGAFPNSGYWKPAWYGSTAGAACTTTAARSGSSGLWTYTADTAGLTWTGTYQDVAAVPGQVAQAGAWIRTPPPGGWVTWAAGSRACVRIEFLNASGLTLAIRESAAVTVANSGWGYYAVTTSPAPAGTVKARYRCYVEKPSNGIAIKSVANFDDCTLSLGAVDTTPPTLTATINNGAKYTNKTAVTINISAKDTGSGMGAGAQMQFSYNPFYWGAAEAYATTKSWTFPAGDGGKTIFVRVKDAAGNWSVSYAASIVLDTVAPSGFFSINGGAQYANTTAVTLALAATDGSSGMGAGSQMQFSNDLLTWSVAEAYATTKSWTLAAGDGLKTVYVRFKDVAGNWSAASSKTIKLDTTAPVLTATINNGARYTRTPAVTINMSATDTGSGMGTGAQMQFSYSPFFWGTGEAYSATKSWTFPTGDGGKTIFVRVRDVAGNWSGGYAAGITLDTIAPFIEKNPDGATVSSTMLAA